MPHGPLALYRAIGEDRYVSAGELPPESGAFGQALWELYDRHFGRFTGAGLDPAFARFARQDARFGCPRFPADVPVIVTGTGAALSGAAAELRERRAHLLIVTTPAGAFALQQHALSPDLVIIERGPGAREDTAAPAGLVLGPRAACLIDPAAPVSAWERTAAVRRLARDLPSWGVWPATAVAVAVAGGATRIALLGVDLDAAAPTGDPAACEALLSALAVHASAQCFEIGAGQTRAGWWPVSWPNLIPPGTPEAQRIDWIDEGGPEALAPEALGDLQRLAPLLPDARSALELARRARAGDAVPSRELTRAVEMLLAWGADPCVRFTLQRALGLTFLPRLWRTGVSMANPSRLWRPLILALNELVEQADRFESRLTTLGHAPARWSPTRSDRTRATGDRTRPLRTGAVDPTRISLIVPVLDDHAFLADTLASLIAQTYENLELLVVHDAARAVLCAPIRELARTNLRLVEAPSSLADALNLGVEAASGGFIAHHGADDVSHPQRLARQMAYLRAHPETGILATAAAFVDADGHPVAGRRDPAPETWTPAALQQRLLFGPCFEHGTVLARRAVIEAAGGYRSRLASAPDQDLWLRLLSTAGFAKLPTRLYTRRLTSAVASLA